MDGIGVEDGVGLGLERWFCGGILRTNWAKWSKKWDKSINYSPQLRGTGLGRTVATLSTMSGVGGLL